jgi:quinol monooxygenase YgiN
MDRASTSASTCRSAEAYVARVIVVTGSILGSPDTIDELVALGLEHVRRSRTEPGCVSHAVHHNVEEPNRLFFFERWANRDVLLAHFAVPESGVFVEAASKLAVERPTMEIYEAETAQL